jgi:hypothetical protein
MTSWTAAWYVCYGMYVVHSVQNIICYAIFITDVSQNIIYYSCDSNRSSQNFSICENEKPMCPDSSGFSHHDKKQKSALYMFENTHIQSWFWGGEWYFNNAFCLYVTLQSKMSFIVFSHFFISDVFMFVVPLTSDCFWHLYFNYNWFCHIFSVLI